MVMECVLKISRMFPNIKKAIEHAKELAENKY